MKVNKIYQKVKNLILAKNTQFTFTEISFISGFLLTAGSRNLQRHWKCPGQNTLFSARSKNNLVEQRDLF